MQKKLILIRTSGQVEQITVSDELELEVLQNLVGGYIECVPTIFGGVEMLINEEGKLHDLKYNEVATDISRVSEYDMIVGDVVLCKINGEHLVGFGEMEAKEICEEIERRFDEKRG